MTASLLQGGRRIGRNQVSHPSTHPSTRKNALEPRSGSASALSAVHASEGSAAPYAAPNRVCAPSAPVASSRSAPTSQDPVGTLLEVSGFGAASGGGSSSLTSLDTKSLKRGEILEDFSGPPEVAKRCKRLAWGHVRALQMADFLVEIAIKSNSDEALKAQIRSFKLRRCGGWLLFRRYLETGECRLRGGEFCQQHLICPLCAVLRGAKRLARFVPRFQQRRPGQRLCLLTLTMPDMASLDKMQAALREGWGEVIQRRRDAHRSLKSKRYRASVFGEMAGGVCSFEIKRGEGSGLWHAHIHALVVRDGWMDQSLIAAEWADILGVDLAIVDIRTVRGSSEDELVKSLCEVFKYALKFSSMSLADNWEAFQTLLGRRLFSSFGCVRGVKDDDCLLDDEGTGLAVDMVYRFVSGLYMLQRIQTTKGEPVNGSDNLRHGHSAPGWPLDVSQELPSSTGSVRQVDASACLEVGGRQTDCEPPFELRVRVDAGTNLLDLGCSVSSRSTHGRRNEAGGVSDGLPMVGDEARRLSPSRRSGAGWGCARLGVLDGLPSLRNPLAHCSDSRIRLRGIWGVGSDTRGRAEEPVRCLIYRAAGTTGWGLRGSSRLHAFPFVE